MPYQTKVDHRNGAPKKSQWSIPAREEELCFNDAFNKDWCGLGRGWGFIHVKLDGARPLGWSAAELGAPRTLYIAKFLDGNSNNQWHGYPADHQNHAQDIPDETFLAR